MEYADWVAVVSPPPDPLGFGSWVAGFEDLLHEVYDTEGPVARDVLDVAVGLRALEVAEAAAAVVLADVHRTTRVRMPVTVRVDQHGTVGVWVAGGCTMPSISALRRPEAVTEMADYLQEAVMEEVWTTWPDCPQHGRCLSARTVGSTSVWACPAGHVVAAVGELDRP